MSIISVLITDTFDQWRIKTNQITALIGDLVSLLTTNKTTVVEAINELKLRIDNQGSLIDLDTDFKTDLVGAINEVNGEADQNAIDIATNSGYIGVLSNLTTDNKATLAEAINETDANIDAVSTRAPYAYDSLQNYGNAGTSIVFDTITYDQCMFTRNAATLVMNAAAMPIGRTFELIMINAAAGTITWPTGTQWPGTIPTFATTGTDRIRLQRISSTVIHATLIGKDY